MAVRRVFVIWTNPLFHESARLLLKHPDIIWVGASANINTARADVDRLNADTILFEKTQAHIPKELVDILEAEAQEIRIIGLSLDNNEMSLYRREHQMVVKPGDLLQFVLG